MGGKEKKGAGIKTEEEEEGVSYGGGQRADSDWGEEEYQEITILKDLGRMGGAEVSNGAHCY